MKTIVKVFGILVLALTMFALLIGAARTQAWQGGEPPLGVPSSADPPAGSKAALVSPPDTNVPDPLGSEAPDVTQVSFRVAGSTLNPRSEGVGKGAGGQGGCAYANSGNAGVVWNTALELPNGSTIKYLRIYYDDVSGSNLETWLTVYDLDGLIVREYNLNSTGTGGNGYVTSAELTETINYDLYSYVLNYRPVILGTNLQLCGFRIFYYPASFPSAVLPYVRK